MFDYLRERALTVLHWSEKYTKTDMTYLARGGSFSLVFQGANIVASLCLAIAISHFVSKESYGIYKYVLSVVSILSLFSLNSIGSAVFQSAAQGFDGALRKAFWDNIRWSALIFAGALVVAGYYFLLGNTTLAIGVLIGGSCAPFLASVSLFNSFLGGKRDFYRQAVYGILDSVIPIAIFIGVIVFTQNPLALVAAYFITNTLAGLFFYRRTVAVYRASMHVHDENMLGYSKHLSTMGILTGIAGNLDQILLFHFVGAAQVAIYNFATAVPDQVKGISGTLSNMLQPRLVARTGEEIKHGMGNKVLWYSLLSLVTVSVYIVVAPYLFRLLFPEYLPAVLYSQLYALWILSIAFDPFSTYLYARKLVKEQYIDTVLFSVCQIAGMVVGVVFWGLAGVIVARVLTRWILGGTYYVLYRRAIGRELRGTT